MSAKETTQQIMDVLDANAPQDNTAVFNYLLNVREQAWEKINAALPLREDLTCQDIHEIPDLEGNTVGNMRTYTGSPLDWVIRSWIGRPTTGFTNIHLTCWADATVDAPHLGFALGTAPDVFYYVDLMPRYDLVANPDYQDKYYLPLNDLYLQLRRDPEVNVFNPPHLYTRSTLTPVALVGLVPIDIFKAKVEGPMLEYVDYWLGLMKNAQPTAESDRPALRQRDELVRRTIVERDPANPLADRLVGPAMRERLVRILWANERDGK